jgi:hypothetical protein
MPYKNRNAEGTLITAQIYADEYNCNSSLKRNVSLELKTLFFI